MILYSNLSENKWVKNSNTQFTPAETGSVFLKERATSLLPTRFVMMQRVLGRRLLSSKSVVWSDEPSAEYCCRRPSALLQLMFDSDTMGVGFDLGLSIDLEMGE